MKVLIRGTNWIGDAVMTMPAIAELRRLLPKANLIIQTRAATAELFRNSGIVDEVLPVTSFVGDVRELRRRAIDLAVILPNSFESALVARIGGAKRIVGYAAQHRSLLLTDAIDVPTWKNDRHEVHYYFELVRTMASRLKLGEVADGPQEPRVVIPDDAREKARALLLRTGVDLKKKTVVLAPGSTNSRAKRWTPEGFAQVSDGLHASGGINVVLMGSPADREVSYEVSTLASHKPFDLTGATDIGLAAAVLEVADLLISNDMGLAHLAPAVGTETIVIFGPTNPVTTQPFSERASIITANVECSPCMLRECPIDHRCMTRVSPDDVLERAKRILEQ